MIGSTGWFPEVKWYSPWEGKVIAKYTKSVSKYSIDGLRHGKKTAGCHGEWMLVAVPGMGCRIRGTLESRCETGRITGESQGHCKDLGDRQ